MWDILVRSAVVSPSFGTFTEGRDDCVSVVAADGFLEDRWAVDVRVDARPGMLIMIVYQDYYQNGQEIAKLLDWMLSLVLLLLFTFGSPQTLDHVF
jgi:hypothetical protein